MILLNILFVKVAGVKYAILRIIQNIEEARFQLSRIARFLPVKFILSAGTPILDPLTLRLPHTLLRPCRLHYSYRYSCQTLKGEYAVLNNIYHT